MLFLTGALALAKGWRLHLLGVYAFLAGAVGVVIGVHILYMLAAGQPILALQRAGLVGAAFIITGLGGALAVPAMHARRAGMRWLVGLLLVAAAAIWLLIGLLAVWGHMVHFMHYKIPTTQPTA